MIAVFNWIQIAEGHEQLTAFITWFKLYKILVTLFGLCNAPATFQNYINYVLHNALDNYCIIYFNNVFVFSKTRVKHIKYVNEIIQRLGNAGLQININKFEFYATKTKYLGLIILTNGITIDFKKVQALQEWKDLMSVKEL